MPGLPPLPSPRTLSATAMTSLS
ncbi:unnamed protein product [Gulo gulo]|uniref:Uncharacterized protein n=1 Tax=Gulo gulo TaxID=48420 RepID=A0A9X9PVE8_GULGU|nr:unnamed protein product [Gulo gulo]